MPQAGLDEALSSFSEVEHSTCKYGDIYSGFFPERLPLWPGHLLHNFPALRSALCLLEADGNAVRLSVRCRLYNGVDNLLS